jgi:hypothetical protein
MEQGIQFAANTKQSLQECSGDNQATVPWHMYVVEERLRQADRHTVGEISALSLLAKALGLQGFNN